MTVVHWVHLRLGTSVKLSKTNSYLFCPLVLLNKMKTTHSSDIIGAFWTEAMTSKWTTSCKERLKWIFKRQIMSVLNSNLRINYRMSHRYWANFSTSYFWLEPIFLGPDSIPMTHETWQSSKASMIVIEIRFKAFIKQNTKYEGFFKSVVLGNLST